MSLRTVSTVLLVVGWLCACQASVEGAPASSTSSTGYQAASTTNGGGSSGGSSGNSGSGTTSGTSGTSGGMATASGGSTGETFQGSISTLAGGGGLECVDAGFDSLDGVALANDGTLYAIGGDLDIVDPSTGQITIIVSDRELSSMDRLGIGPSGRILVSAFNAQYIEQVFEVTGSTVGLYAGNGSQICGVAQGDGGVGFDEVGGIAVDSDDNLFVSDMTHELTNCDQILKIAANGVASTVAGVGTPGARNGSGSLALFNQPSGIVIGDGGLLYVADSKNNVIRTVAPDGITNTFVGSGTAILADGIGQSASFSNPTALAIDGNGNLYVADTGNNRIRFVDPGGHVMTLVGNGMHGLINGTLGPNGTSQFSGPDGIAVDAAGSVVYVADQGNCALRVVHFTGP